MSRAEIEARYNALCAEPSDINEHMPTLRRYASQCNHVTEMGVRAVVSTYGLLTAFPNVLRCYDIHRHTNVDVALRLATDAGVDMKFFEEDVLTVRIEPTDLLLIDTLHIYTQLKKELFLHADAVRKWICLHDTTTWGEHAESYSWQTPEIMKNYVNGDRGIWPAVEEFIEHGFWRIKERFTHNNGLTILERVP